MTRRRWFLIHPYLKAVSVLPCSNHEVPARLDGGSAPAPAIRESFDDRMLLGTAHSPLAWAAAAQMSLPNCSIAFACSIEATP